MCQPCWSSCKFLENARSAFPAQISEDVVPGLGCASPDSWHGGLFFRFHCHFLSKAFKSQYSLILPTGHPYIFFFFCNSIISSVLVSFATVTNNPKFSSLQQYTFISCLSHFSYSTSAPCISNPETCVKEAAFIWDKLSLRLTGRNKGQN